MTTPQTPGRDGPAATDDSANEGTPFAGTLLAFAIGAFAASVDLHNDEPQAAALVLIVGGFLIGAIWPVGAWRWAMILGLAILVGDPIGVQLGVKPPWPGTGFNVGSVIALVPAFIGTYAGVGVRALLRSTAKTL